MHSHRARPALDSDWWSRGWLNLLAELSPQPTESGRGLSRRCKVQRLEIQPGQIVAQLRDRELGFGSVTIRWPVLTATQWQQILESLSAQAIFTAQLLAGDMPHDIEQLFSAAGVRLLPTHLDELQIACSLCGADPTACIHLPTVLAQIAQTMGDDPWLLFQLRGKERQKLLQALREHRMSRQESTTQTPAPAAQTLVRERQPFYHLNPNLTFTPIAPPLEADPAHFWGHTQGLEELHHHIARPTIELALLRRLGYPPFAADNVETYERLAQIYRTVTEQVLDLAFAPDPDADEE